MQIYAEETKVRWGHTPAYKESENRVKKMSKQDMAQIQKEADLLMNAIAAHIGENPDSNEVQMLIAKHYHNLNHFYTPNLELYRGLADMYVSDPRFTAYFEKYAKGLTQFMHDAMHHYCDTH